jgi:probable HAF family extracellular repeat protein
MRARLLPAGIAAILIGSPAAIASYSFTTLTDPNANGYTVASGINDAGEVVGSYKDSSNTTHGFSFVSGAFTTLNATSATLSTSANGVNNLGQIIGSFNDAAGASHGFVLNLTVYTPFDNPSGVGATYGTGINSSGQLVGNYFDSSQLSRAYSATGGIPPNSFTAVNALTGVGANVSVNSNGAVVGSYVSGSATHGFVTMGATTMTLDDPLALGGVTAATGINDAGDIVGYFTDGSNMTHGFVDIGGNFTTIDATASGPTEVFGINNLGDLVGRYVDANGEVQGFVASVAVPEPGTLALLGMSLASTMVLRRQRKSGCRGDGEDVSALAQPQGARTVVSAVADAFASIASAG